MMFNCNEQIRKNPSEIPAYEYQDRETLNIEILNKGRLQILKLVFMVQPTFNPKVLDSILRFSGQNLNTTQLEIF
jgi:hypothetical protein